MLRPALAFAAQLLWPARCAACDELVSPDRAFCEPCTLTLVPLERTCPRCALPIAEPPCRCAAELFPFAHARAAFAYGGAITDALLRFKHGGRLDLARPLGRSFLPVLGALVTGIDAVLAVPLHPRRLRARGYNQALELARAARAAVRGGASWPRLWVDVLLRIRDTPVLGRLSPRERRALVADAFVIPDPARVRGKALLVVDDVMTTGATLAGCAQALRAAGAAEVRVASFARALTANSP
jgi:predicted amidophosphoribosyltransferase